VIVPEVEERLWQKQHYSHLLRQKLTDVLLCVSLASVGFSGPAPFLPGPPHSFLILCFIRIGNVTNHSQLPNAAGCGKAVVWFDYELGEKNHMSGFVCDDHKVSNRVEKLAQPTAASVA
jgi:hypothetical protein